MILYKFPSNYQISEIDFSNPNQNPQEFSKTKIIIYLKCLKICLKIFSQWNYDSKKGFPNPIDMREYQIFTKFKMQIYSISNWKIITFLIVLCQSF
jgi:hypothetical protein